MDITQTGGVVVIEPGIRTYVYGIRFGRYVKIGVTRDLSQRLASLPGGVRCPADWADTDARDREPLFAVPGSVETERLVHTLAGAVSRREGEWFDASGRLLMLLRDITNADERARLFDLHPVWLPAPDSPDVLPAYIEF